MRESLGGIKLRERTNIIIAAVISPSGDTAVNPTGETVIESFSTLIAMGERKDLDELEDIIIGKGEPR